MSFDLFLQLQIKFLNFLKKSIPHSKVSNCYFSFYIIFCLPISSFFIISLFFSFRSFVCFFLICNCNSKNLCKFIIDFVLYMRCQLNQANVFNAEWKNYNSSVTKVIKYIQFFYQQITYLLSKRFILSFTLVPNEIMSFVCSIFHL